MISIPGIVITMPGTMITFPRNRDQIRPESVISLGRSRHARACLVDACGTPLWNHDVGEFPYCKVSDLGAAAFMGGAGSDSVWVHFVGADGAMRGVWCTTADSVSWSWCQVDFLPRSENFAIVSPVKSPTSAARGHGRDGPPTLRLIAPSGASLWCREELLSEGV